MRYAIKRTHSDGSTSVLCTANSLERVGKWMGERYVTVDVNSPRPIAFEIGDYIEYSGERFTLRNIPSVTKQARPGTHGAAFTYNAIKFESCVSELSKIRFFDSTGKFENGIHFAQVASFSFICRDLLVFAERVQANLDRWYDEQKAWYDNRGLRNPLEKPWRVQIPRTFEAATNVTIEVSRQSVLDVLENVVKKFNTTYTIREKDDAKYICLCDDGAELLGMPAMEYGMGNGLLSIERSSNSEKQIITRLRAYGSTKNLQSHYYSDIYEPWYKLQWTETGNGYMTTVVLDDTTSITFGIVIPVIYTSNRPEFVVYFDNHPGLIFTEAHVESFDGSLADSYIANNQWCERYRGGTHIQFVVTDSDTIAEIKKDPMFFVGDIVFKSGILKKYATRHKDWWIAPYPTEPNFYAVSNLMLPMFLSWRVMDGDKEIWLNPATCQLLYEDANNPKHVTCVMSEGKRYAPIYKKAADGNDILEKVAYHTDAYIDDEKMIEKYGIIEEEVYFDDENNEETGHIFPTMEGITANDARRAGYTISIGDDDNGYLDEVAVGAGQYYTENGDIKDAPSDLAKAFEDFREFGADGFGDDGIMRVTDDDNRWMGKRVQFYFFANDFGFDPKEYLGKENAKILVKSGGCTAREFELVEGNMNPVQIEKDGVKYWRFHCQRFLDTTLNIYYPNNNDTFSGELKDEERSEDVNGRYKHSDRFVLTNFDMPRMYVDLAAARLERAAIGYMEKRNRSAFTYVPKIDSVMMQRSRDFARITGDASYHDVLCEGLLMNITDSDLGIFQGVDTSDRKFHIDSLTVKESGDKLPEYSIVLKETSEVSLLTKIQKQITTITRTLSNISSGGSNVVIADNNTFTANSVNIQAGGVDPSMLKGYAKKDEDNVFTGTNTFEGDTLLDSVSAREYLTNDAAETGRTLGGAAMFDDADGGHVFTDFLEVRRAAMFRTLTIAEVEHLGGEVVLSAASCQIAFVERVPIVSESPKGRASLPMPGVQYGYRCYFEKRANGRVTYNEWKKGDQAYCCRWSIDETGKFDRESIDGATSYYWRLVVDTGETEDYWYIDLSEDDCDMGSGVPKVNDHVVLLGHRGTDRSRTCAQIYSVVSANAPSRYYYEGIDSYQLPTPIEKMEYDDGKAHWRVGNGSTYIDYNGKLTVKADEVTIGSEKTINVGETLGDKFDIYYLGEDAPRDEKNQIRETLMPSEIEVSAEWESDGTSDDHTMDVLLTTDGVSYHYEHDEETDTYKWVNTTDQYLLRTMQFVNAFETSDTYAQMFSKVIDPETGKTVLEAKAGTAIFKDASGKLNTEFRVEAGMMTVETANFKLDGNGNIVCNNARIRGFIYRNDTEITPENFEDYKMDPVDKLSALQYPELDFRKTGPNIVVTGNHGSSLVIVLPSLMSSTKPSAEALAMVRSMIGENVCIINGTQKPLFVRFVIKNSNGTFSFDSGDGQNIPPGYAADLVCRRGFDNSAKEGIYWTVENGGVYPAELHKPNVSQ